MAVAKLLQKFHHGHVVVKRRGRADDLVEVGGDLHHFFQRVFQILGGPKIVVGKDQGRLAPQALHLFRLALGGTLQFDVEQLAAGGGGLPQNVQLGRQGTLELPPAGGAPAGRDGREVGVVFHEPLDSGERERRPGQIV